ncbi:MAG: protease SohB [Candidatus Portiera sp.]|nr:protease SohB [Portiera sp.]
MEFLSEYGIFVAKFLTSIILVVIFFAIIIGMIARTRQTESTGKVKITSMNQSIKDVKMQIQSYILSPKEFKQLVKNNKKEEKKKNKGKNKESKKPPIIYVVNFVGDMQASNLKYLTDTISAIISVAKPKQEVVLKLESGGGYVHSYGLAAAQLLRLKEHNIQLTVCIDKVAASGGYLMAAMADKICAAPFAILGSIGVVGMVPNINKALQKQDIDVEYHTSGDYKRTLTVLGKNDAKGRKKFQEDLKQTHKLFKDVVKEHRPSLSLPKVATGEVWYGIDAKKHKLIDMITTSDEYLHGMVAKAELYEVSVKAKRKITDRIGKASEEAVSGVVDKLLAKIMKLRLFHL